MYHNLPIIFVLTSMNLSSCSTTAAKQLHADNYPEIKECPSPVCIKVKNLQHYYFKPVYKQAHDSQFNLEECIIRF